MRMSALLTKLQSTEDPMPVMRGQVRQERAERQERAAPCCQARDQRLARLEQELRAEREREQVRGVSSLVSHGVMMCCRKEGGTEKTFSLLGSWWRVRTR